jgi:hypothetical protein
MGAITADALKDPDNPPADQHGGRTLTFIRHREAEGVEIATRPHGCQCQAV